jgi:hypothetical protein
VNEYDTELEEYFDYWNAFLMGFRYKETIPSAMNCTKYLEGSIYKMNETQNTWEDPEIGDNVTTKEKVFNYTSWISYDLAPSSRYCFTTTLQMYVWYLHKSTQFETWGDIFAAWLQNLLGNVITFNKLKNKIKIADEEDNFREQYYWYGRFATLFINFEPIKDDAFEDEEFNKRHGYDPDNFNDLYSEMQLIPQRNSRINEDDFRRLLMASPLVESPRVRGLFGSALGFVSGYVNASLGNASPNSGIC